MYVNRELNRRSDREKYGKYLPVFYFHKIAAVLLMIKKGI